MVCEAWLASVDGSTYITLDMQLSYEFVKPPTEPAPYVKESKDSKNAPVTEAPALMVRTAG